MSTTLKDDTQPLSAKELGEIARRACTIPFPMPDEEVERIFLLSEDARERGDNEECERIFKQIPVSWETAQTIIQYQGRTKLMKMGWDLSYAVAVLGERYVYGE